MRGRAVEVPGALVPHLLKAPGDGAPDAPPAEPAGALVLRRAGAAERAESSANYDPADEVFDWEYDT